MGYVSPVNTAVCLEHVFESNYNKLLKLIPNLLTYKERAIGKSSEKPDLELNILENSPHTLTIKLSHYFNQELSDFSVPDVIVRIYLDAQLAEVIRDHARSSVTAVYRDWSKTKEIMTYKWRLNYFLQKWLDYCLNSGYQFSALSASSC